MHSLQLLCLLEEMLLMLVPQKPPKNTHCANANPAVDLAENTTILHYIFMTLLQNAQMVLTAPTCIRSSASDSLKSLLGQVLACRPWGS